MKTRLMVIVLPILVFSACAGSIQKRASEQASVPGADSSYGDLSEKEDCILNYERSCNDRNIDRFAELFQENCEFIFIMGQSDSDAAVLLGPRLKKWNLKNELRTTGLFFAGAHELRFEIEAGRWTQLDSLNGSPCTDCWEATRAYSLSAAFTASGEAAESDAVKGHGHMTFIVSPVNGKWKILKHIDQPINEPQNQ